MRIKEGERKNKTSVPLSRIELIVLADSKRSRPARTTTAHRRTAVRHRASSIRTASFAGTTPEQNRRPMRRTARWSGATAQHDNSQRRLRPHAMG
eukprot:406374-Prymnesium_polylepis.1